MKLRIRTQPSKVVIARATLLLFFTMAVISVAAPGSAQDVPECNVLILCSSNRGDPWTEEISRGIESELRTCSRPVHVYHEYIDSNTIDENKYLQKLYELYRVKFSGIRFDAVICIDDFAFNFLLQRHRDLFPGTPIIYCGVNHVDPALLQNKPEFTGIEEELEIKKTLDAAIALHHTVPKVFVVNDATATGIASKQRMMEVLPEYGGTVSVTFLENMTRGQLEASLGNLPTNAIVLYLGFSRDSYGEVFDGTDGLDIVTTHCPRPVYSLWDYCMGHGVVGGMLLRGFDHGVEAGRRAVHTLSPASNSSTTGGETSSGYVFDFEQLRTFGLRAGDLPPGSTLINEPVSVIALPWYVWGGIGVSTALIAVILVLLISFSKRQQAEERIRESEEKFRGIAQRAFEMIYMADPEGALTYVSPAAQRITGYVPDEIIGRRIQALLPDSELAGFDRVIRSVMRGENIDDYEMKITRKDGSVTIVETNFSPIMQDGEITGIQGAARDIAEKKEVEKLKKQAFQQIEKNIEQFQILNDQIRNPLAVIIGLSDLQDNANAQQILKQAWQINEIVTKLDKGCIESEKVRAYLRRTYEKE